MRRVLALGALLLLTGCAFEGEKFGPLPSDIAPLFGGGSVPARAPAPHVPATGASKMLQDPEGQLQDNGIEVVAGSQTQAENLCQDIAAARSDAQTIVTCLGCRMRTKTTGKFVCTIRTEHVPLPPQQP